MPLTRSASIPLDFLADCTYPTLVKSSLIKLLNSPNLSLISLISVLRVSVPQLIELSLLCYFILSSLNIPFSFFSGSVA